MSRTCGCYTIGDCKSPPSGHSRRATGDCKSPPSIYSRRATGDCGSPPSGHSCHAIGDCRSSLSIQTKTAPRKGTPTSRTHLEVLVEHTPTRPQHTVPAAASPFQTREASPFPAIPYRPTSIDKTVRRSGGSEKWILTCALDCTSLWYRAQIDLGL